MNIKLIIAATVVLALSACSQEKVCEMGKKAYDQNAANIAKVEADVASNPTDQNKSLLAKVKEQQAKLGEQLKAANCPGVDAAPAAAAAGTTAAATEPTLADGTVAETGRGTFKAADGKEVTAVYTSDEMVTLTLPDGSTKKLKQAVSGSGIRFVDGDQEWIEHQGEGMYSVGGEKVFDGKNTK